MNKMKFLVTIFMFFGLAAHADQVVKLTPAETQAARFLSQCVDSTAGRSFVVEQGHRGTFLEGILISFDLKSKNGDVATLEVRWEKATRSYSCKLFTPDK